MTIPELFDNELKFWTKVNQSFLGVSPIDETLDFKDIQAQIDKDCELYWNCENPCKLARNLNSGKLNKDASKQTKNSYCLKLNFYNMCIDVYGDYDGKLLKICAIPTPCNDLCWIINKAHYVTRVTAVKDWNCFVSKRDFETVHGEGWEYNIHDDKFTCIYKKTELIFEPTIENIFNEHLSNRSKILLQYVLNNQPLTIDNFKLAMRKLPTFPNDSIFNYKFSRIEYFEDIILNSNKYAQPTKKILLGVNTIIGSKSKQYSTSGERLEGCLVRSDSRIFSLENFRTCVNIFNNPNSKDTTGKSKNNNYQPAFTYSDINGFFDSFKTVTSRAAGRQRLLLDNVVVKENMLWIVDDKGELHHMYEYMDMPQSKRLSCLSESPFCNNDKPKRIMMNAKMTSQAVPLKEEVDNLTHRIKARVGFTDIEGYTSADSIIISESFAKRLRTFEEAILYLNKKSKIYTILTSTENFTVNELKEVFPSKNDAILSNYENFHIERIDDVDVNNARVFLKWDIPFRLGDKITNLHGAKGTVGLILPDDQMPYLNYKVGNMEPGPLEIIISGFSTIRRGSLGQIFEAWKLASGIDDGPENDFNSIMINKYQDQMKVYSENSLVTFNGQSNIIPVGINYIMRLYHHAATHISCSSADFAYKKTLKLGEMEKLNLVANECPNILKELGIRSISKYIGSHKHIANMQATRHLPENTQMSLQFIELVKSMGYEIIIEDESDKDIELDEKDIHEFNSIIKKELASNEDNS